MLRYLAHSMLYRRLGRAIPNPILRTLAIAGAGMAARRLMARRAAQKAAPHATPPGTPLRAARARRAGGRATSRIVTA
jgi:hypothetical protein